MGATPATETPGELFERTFSADTTVPILAALRRAYATACEHHVPARGSNEVTFGINLYFHAVHEICAEAARLDGALRVASRQPIFRLEAGPYELACHRVGLSERESIWSSFPRNEGAAALMVEEQLWLPGLAPERGIAAARRLVLAHLGNADEGMRAVYLAIPGKSEGGRITAWAFARAIYRAGEARAELPAPAQLEVFADRRPSLPPEEIIAAPVVRRRPKKAPHEAAG